MKKIVIWLLVVFCILLLGFEIMNLTEQRARPIAPNSINRSKSSYLGFLNDSINQNYVSVPEELAKDAIHGAHENIQLPDGSKIDMRAEEISSEAITGTGGFADTVEYYCEAASGTSSSCTNSICAIEIFYGLSGGELKLYYKPVLYCSSSSSFTAYGQGGSFFREYSKTETPSVYYSYNSNTQRFDRISDTVTANGTIRNYRSNTNGIRIARTSTTNPSSVFVHSTSIDGDVKSMIFPLDEFKEITRSNTTIKLWNALEDLHWNGEIYTKHILLLSTGNVYDFPKNTWILTPGYTKFANLSHLCPPSCNTNVIFSVDY